MAKLRVLIVDDDESIHDLICGLLGDKLFEFEHARDTNLAVDRFSSFLPDLVLLDINMPGANGFVALRRMRSLARDASRTCKIVMLTGNTTREDVSTALAYGADDYMAKPIDKKTLAHKILRHFPGAVG